MKRFSSTDLESAAKLADVIRYRECMIHSQSASLLQDGATIQLVTCCESFDDSIHFYFRHSHTTSPTSTSSDTIGP